MSGEEAPSVRIAVLGLGEAGGLIAADLRDAGARVQGYDPAASAPEGVADLPGEAAAAAGCDLVLSVNSSKAAPGALQAGLSGTGPGTVWADLNTAAPQLKRRLGETAAEAGVAFADVSLMSPVPGRGLHTPMLASGPGAARYAELMGRLGADVEAMDGPAGLAAERKLLRSVFFKGLAAAVVEALEAGRAAGCEDWLRDNIADELARADAGTVQRLVEGSRLHAVRRTDEMQAASDMLTDLGVAPLISAASRDLLQNLQNRA
ncbi:6-phosphogluconate dehydrogenase [Streptomonospora alba]|uniref:6-phosphogluconate dehydrogenase n=1 Tax=Streptomonospora alba TaxID=183763 RepID=A0A0C2JH73_9ACTN|nr:NAD(P)-dependent oxidoreductase [Streptomonospora alba]KIH98240.1 6-phosphogluconate dehydrogenase [Streptomonospora alba]